MVERARRAFRFARRVLVAAGKRFGYVRANRMAAAIAYRTVFSLSPLLFFAVGVVGAIVGDDFQARAEILSNVERVAGATVAEAVGAFLDATVAAGDTAAVLGVLLVMWTSSSLFLELQRAQDDIFGVPHEETKGVVAFLKKRGKGMLWTIGLGFILLAVWLLNFAWRFVAGLFPPEAAGVHQVIGVVAPLVSLVLLPVVFALIFQTLTSITVPWRAIWYGSGFTASVFLLAAYAIGIYFAWNTEPSGITVAGSIFAVLLLAFVLSSVYLFGVTVTKVYADVLAEEPSQFPEAPSH
ncbi:MAG: YihY/virulence factor BrkB family protein [Acidimicrobiia bacterium]|nr:YihY/virulence factor BrkB family protein [Acidimicrobiia bacterium]